MLNTVTIDRTGAQRLADAKTPMIDPFGRAITYLRVSVTDRCDFRCTYCMAEDMTFLPKRDLLTLEELDRLASAFVAKGVRRLRLTGGRWAGSPRPSSAGWPRRTARPPPGPYRRPTFYVNEA